MEVLTERQEKYIIFYELSIRPSGAGFVIEGRNERKNKNLHFLTKIGNGVTKGCSARIKSGQKNLHF